jgi:hypothetical protein
MPLDNFMSRMYFYHRAQWELKFAWLPHRCNLTKRIIWLSQAYRGTVMWTGPSEPEIETVWHSKNQHLIWMLKNV